MQYNSELKNLISDLKMTFGCHFYGLLMARSDLQTLDELNIQYLYKTIKFSS